MKPAPLILLITLAVLLFACEEDQKSSGRRRDDNKATEIARLKAEMERRVSKASNEHALRAARLRTIRITAFVLLTGGAVTWIILIHRHARNGPAVSGVARSSVPAIRPQWSDHLPPSSGRSRVIEIPPQVSTPDAVQSHPPVRHRRKRKGGRHPRRRNHI